MEASLGGPASELAGAGVVPGFSLSLWLTAYAYMSFR